MKRAILDLGIKKDNNADSLAKSNDGIGLPQFSKAHSRQLLAGFFMRAIQHTQIMVGWVGALRRAVPWSGKTNLTQFTTQWLVSLTW